MAAIDPIARRAVDYRENGRGLAHFALSLGAKCACPPLLTRFRTGSTLRFGFTLVELLVVIGIIGVLMAMAVPAIQSAREASRSATCRSNLRQLALGVDMFEGATGNYPPGQFLGTFGKGPNSTAWSWLARILPYIEETNLYKAGGVPTSVLQNSGIMDKSVVVSRCASDGASGDSPSTNRGNLENFPVGLTNYKAVCGANWGADASQNLTNIGTDWTNPGTNGSFDGLGSGDGIMYRSDISVRRRKSQVSDGLSKTFLLGEDIPAADVYCSWPYSNNAYSTCAIPPNVVPRDGSDYTPLWWPNVQGFRSAHPGGVNFAMGDDRAVFVSDAIDLKVYHSLATIAGGESFDYSTWVQ